MAHKRRNGKFYTRKKRANHGKLGSIGTEKSQFNRYRRTKDRPVESLV